MKKYSKQSQLSNIHAFTLLELSVTLAIIALIVASITTGISMKRSLELKNLYIKDLITIRDAITEFKTKYALSIPGDYIYEGSGWNNDAANYGNGNNQLENLGDGEDERIHFWNHLTLTAPNSTSLASSIVGSKTDNKGRYVGSLKSSVFWADTIWPPATNDHGTLYIRVSRYNDEAGGTNQATGLFTTKEAYSYESKFDNHNPSSGNIRFLDGTDSSEKDCVNTDATPDELNFSKKDSSPCVMYLFINVNS